MHILGGLSAVGGTPRKLLYLVRQADQEEFEHSFLCTEPGTLTEEYERAGAKVSVVGSSGPSTMLHAALKFAKQVRPDVISTHFTRPFACGAVVARLLRLPLIHNEHGPATIGLEDHSLQGRLGRLVRKSWLRYVDALVCNSRYTARTVVDMFAVPEEPVVVIHNPVEPRSDTRRDRGVRNESASGTRLCIGHIGGMIPSRDQGTLLRAVRLLRDLGIDARLILVGDGVERAALTRLAAELELESAVDFWGYRSDLREFFDLIDVYVNPCVAEGFGIAVVEAMLEGVPVVVANAGAHPEIVEHQRTGVLFESHDANVLTHELAMFTRDDTRRAMLGAAGREYAIRTFAPYRYARAYEDVLRGVVERRRLPSRAGVEAS